MSLGLLVLGLVLGGPAAQAQALELPGAAADPDAGRFTPDEVDEVDEAEEDAADVAADEAGELPAPGAYGGYVMPSPPALSALDGAGESFDEPSSPSDFAVAAGTFFDDEGELQSGGAVEVGTRALGLTRSLTHAQYRDKAALRVLSRTYLSAATARSSDRQDILAALGLRTVLFDGADPLLAEDYAEASARAVASCEPLRTEDLDAWSDCVAEAYVVEAEEVLTPAWNAAGLSLSLAYQARFVDKALSGYQSQLLKTWVSGAVPAGSSTQLGLSLGWSEDLQDVVDELPSILLTRMGSRGVRLTVVTGHVLQLPTASSRSAGARVASAIPVQLGGEFQVDDELWLQTMFGLVIEPQADEVTLLTSASFQWGQASEPSFKDAP